MIDHASMVLAVGLCLSGWLGIHSSIDYASIISSLQLIKVYITCDDENSKSCSEFVHNCAVKCCAGAAEILQVLIIKLVEFLVVLITCR